MTRLPTAPLIPRERSETAKDKIRALMDALNTERKEK